MSYKDSILKQILQIIPRHEFEKSVKKYNGDFASKGFTCWEQYLSMLFAQLSGQTGLRGIETALDSIKNMLYHLWVKKIKRSTLSYANNNRPSEIYENVFNGLLTKIFKMEFNKGEVVTFERGYTDFKLFANYCNADIYFVTRLKKNADYKIVERKDISPIKNVL